MVLEYADGITRTPVEVSESLFARLREGFNEAELVELTSAVTWENYRARFSHAFGIEAPKEPCAHYLCERQMLYRGNAEA